MSGLALSALFFSSLAMAASQDFNVQAKGAKDFGVDFSIGYTFGVHVGRAQSATGTVSADLSPLTLTAARFSVPISSMTTGDDMRDCHMREALGIDYSKSKFPGSHVCNARNETPASGPDSIAFPTIDFELIEWAPSSSTPILNPLALAPGQAIDINAVVKVTLHGVSQKLNVPLHAELFGADNRQVRVTSSFPVKLADFGIIVKPAAIVTVKDRATVKLDLLLAPAAIPGA